MQLKTEHKALLILGGIVLAAVAYKMYTDKKKKSIIKTDDTADAETGTSEFAGAGRYGFKRGGAAGRVMKKTCRDTSTFPATDTRVPLTSPCPQGSSAV